VVLRASPTPLEKHRSHNVAFRFTSTDALGHRGDDANDHGDTHKRQYFGQHERKVKTKVHSSPVTSKYAHVEHQSLRPITRMSSVWENASRQCAHRGAGPTTARTHGRHHRRSRNCCGFSVGVPQRSHFSIEERGENGVRVSHLAFFVPPRASTTTMSMRFDSAVHCSRCDRPLFCLAFGDPHVGLCAECRPCVTCNEPCGAQVLDAYFDPTRCHACSVAAAAAAAATTSKQ